MWRARLLLLFVTLAPCACGAHATKNDRDGPAANGRAAGESERALGQLNGSMAYRNRGAVWLCVEYWDYSTHLINRMLQSMDRDDGQEWTSRQCPSAGALGACRSHDGSALYNRAPTRPALEIWYFPAGPYATDTSSRLRGYCERDGIVGGTGKGVWITP